jgi:hypothetical protein
MNLSAYHHTVCLTGHEYMARSGRLRRPGRGLKYEDQFKPRTGAIVAQPGGGFRLIVDD